MEIEKAVKARPQMRERKAGIIMGWTGLNKATPRFSLAICTSPKGPRGRMPRDFTTMGGLNSEVMRLLRFAGLALASFCFCIQAIPSRAQSQQASTLPQGAIRVSVDRVNVGVIVTDAQGHFVEGLHREDFLVLDNLAQQPLTDFSTVEEPAQVLLLIEAGPAVYLLEGGHLQAAYSLLNGLSAGYRVAVVKYAD